MGLLAYAVFEGTTKNHPKIQKQYIKHPNMIYNFPKIPHIIYIYESCHLGQFQSMYTYISYLNIICQFLL